MKRLFVLMILFLSVSCQQPPERDCSAFRTGTFETFFINNGDTLTATIERNEEREIEFFSNKKDTASVRWINGCEYILKNLRPKNRDEEKAVHIKILTTTDSSYTFEFSTVGSSKKLKGTAFKRN